MSAGITGTITLDDGSTSEFSIDREFGFSQWGADPRRLGRSVDVVAAMVEGLQDADIFVSEIFEGEDDDENDDDGLGFDHTQGD